MALSSRFESLRRQFGSDSSVVIDPDFLREKIYVPTAEMAPRHSWGGSATTQTKIDVKDEDIEANKGNLAYRFKAAKSIYAKVEDSTLEPYGRDESASGRVQLNKTCAFNVDKLLEYNERPVRLDEMGYKLYYKHDEFLRRKIKERENLRLGLLASADESASSLLSKKRSLEALVEESTSTSPAKREKISDRLASKSCLPQLRDPSATAPAGAPSCGVYGTPAANCSSSLSNDLSALSGSGRNNDVYGGPVKASHSSSSTESAASSQMGVENMPDSSFGVAAAPPVAPSYGGDLVPSAVTSDGGVDFNGPRSTTAFPGSGAVYPPTSLAGTAAPYLPASLTGVPASQLPSFIGADVSYPPSYNGAASSYQPTSFNGAPSPYPSNEVATLMAPPFAVQNLGYGLDPAEKFETSVSQLNAFGSASSVPNLAYGLSGISQQSPPPPPPPRQPPSAPYSAAADPTANQNLALAISSISHRSPPPPPPPTPSTPYSAASVPSANLNLAEIKQERLELSKSVFVEQNQPKPSSLDSAGPLDSTQMDISLSVSVSDPLNTSTKKSKKSKEAKEIPPMPVLGYARTDPRTYDYARGVKVVSDLLALDPKKLVNNWVNEERRAANGALQTHMKHAGTDMKHPRTGLKHAQTDMNHARTDWKHDASSLQSRRSVDPRIIAKEKVNGRRSEAPRLKSEPLFSFS